MNPSSRYGYAAVATFIVMVWVTGGELLLGLTGVLPGWWITGPEYRVFDVIYHLTTFPVVWGVWYTDYAMDIPLTVLFRQRRLYRDTLIMALGVVPIWPLVTEISAWIHTSKLPSVLIWSVITLVFVCIATAKATLWRYWWVHTVPSIRSRFLTTRHV